MSKILCILRILEYFHIRGYGKDRRIVIAPSDMCSQAFLGQPLKGNSIPPTITPEMVHVSELVATVAVMYN